MWSKRFALCFQASGKRFERKLRPMVYRISGVELPCAADRNVARPRLSFVHECCSWNRFFLFLLRATPSPKRAVRRHPPNSANGPSIPFRLVFTLRLTAGCHRHLCRPQIHGTLYWPTVINLPQLRRLFALDCAIHVGQRHL
jgi:hypothetical protein